MIEEKLVETLIIDPEPAPRAHAAGKARTKYMVKIARQYIKNLNSYRTNSILFTEALSRNMYAWAGPCPLRDIADNKEECEHCFCFLIDNEDCLLGEIVRANEGDLVSLPLLSSLMEDFVKRARKYLKNAK